MRNKENIGHIVQGKHAIISLLVLCVCVCVCVCVFPSTVKASPDCNKTINVMPEIRPAMLCCVKNLCRHVIDNHSRDLQASSCAK